MKNKKTAGALLKFFQGIIIGVGGVLPGVSGGVLCVAFGLYKPLMEVLASPIKNIKKHFSLLLPTACGMLLGFLVLVRAVSALMASYEELASCAFAGLILGTVPSLIAGAREKKRSRGSVPAFSVSFILIFGLFMLLRTGEGVNIQPSFFWFAFAGAVWGISIILPGISSASILMFMGVFTPIVDGAKNFDFSVIIPLAIGGVGTILLLAKLMNRLLEKYPAPVSYAIIGIVTATTLPILPVHFTSVLDFAVKALLVAGGFAAAYMFDYIGKKIS